jgi:hypothetical protein
MSPESKMRSPDRVLQLELIDGMKPLNSMGIVDPRLFKDGEDANRLHAIMDAETCLWSFKYEKGGVPPALTGKYTGFKAAKKFAEDYFVKRNIRIKEIKD